jgi:hypothetical protein
MLQLTQQKYNYIDGEEAEVWDEIADDITHQSKLFYEIFLFSSLGTFSRTLSLSLSLSPLFRGRIICR